VLVLFNFITKCDNLRLIMKSGGISMQINGYNIDDALLKSIETKVSEGDNVYPPMSQRFRALELTAFSQVKIVIIGQDPYHGEGQANGLAFSVNDGVKVPPSLRNIFKELDINPQNGDLTAWAKQGVLMLNAVLSVEASKPASHAKLGWERITDDIICQLNKRDEPLVFMLWGAYAQKKGALIDREKHLILETTHPSTFSAHKGFLGSGCFVKANAYLKANGLRKIDWNL
jgi:uracil-DNA glycosylase